MSDEPLKREYGLDEVSVEPDFDYGWLDAEPPGYEDVDEDGQVVVDDGPLSQDPA